MNKEMTMEMELKIEFNAMRAMIERIASKFAREYSYVEKEDIAQEMWMKAWITNPDNIALANTICLNAARDYERKCRKLRINDEYDFRTEMLGDEDRSFDDVCKDLEMSRTIISRHMYNDPEEEVALMDLIERLKDECDRKVYVLTVAKAYLSGGFSYLEDMYKEIYSELTEDDKNMLYNTENEDSVDAIAKIFLGVKTGTNAGSVRGHRAVQKNYFSRNLGIKIK